MSELDPASSRRSTRMTAALCARLSRSIPARIVCCSHASERTHADLGYDRSRMVVIPNGFDLAQFRSNREAGAAFRNKLAIPHGASVVGMAARFHPQKDHRNFVAAAGILHTTLPAAWYLLCGDGIDDRNQELARLLASAGIKDQTRLLGRCDDMCGFYNAIDCAALSSSDGEALPLTIGEAMACGRLCVVTDVGDSADVVGCTGIAVPIRNPEELAQGWSQILQMPADARLERSQAARRRIEERYDLDIVTARYETLYREVKAQCAG